MNISVNDTSREKETLFSFKVTSGIIGLERVT